MNKALYLPFLICFCLKAGNAFDITFVVSDAHEKAVRTHFAFGKEIVNNKKNREKVEYSSGYLTAFKEKGRECLPTVQTNKGIFALDYDQNTRTLDLIKPVSGIKRLFSSISSLHQRDTLVIPEGTTVLKLSIINAAGDIKMSTSSKSKVVAQDDIA